MTAALELTALSSGYGSALVVRNVSVLVSPGEVVALLGKNGMGKTTLLRTVMGYLRPMHGTVRAFGRDMGGTPVHARAREGIGYVPQERALFQDLPVRDNIRLGLPNDRGLPQALARVRALFPFLMERLAQKAGTLSGGEQKMLLLARALAADPRLLLIDEVTEGLQPSIVDRLAGVITAESRQAGRAILLVEQHVGFALRVADRYAVLKGGEIVAEGRAADANAATTVMTHLQV